MTSDRIVDRDDHPVETPDLWEPYTKGGGAPRLPFSSPLVRATSARLEGRLHPQPERNDGGFPGFPMAWFLSGDGGKFSAEDITSPHSRA